MRFKSNFLIFGLAFSCFADPYLAPENKLEEPAEGFREVALRIELPGNTLGSVKVSYKTGSVPTSQQFYLHRAPHNVQRVIHTTLEVPEGANQKVRIRIEFTDFSKSYILELKPDQQEAKLTVELP